MHINGYIDGMPEYVAKEKAFVANVPTTTGHSKIMEEIQAEQAQMAGAMAHMTTMFATLYAGLYVGAVKTIMAQTEQQRKSCEVSAMNVWNLQGGWLA